MIRRYNRFYKCDPDGKLVEIVHQFSSESVAPAIHCDEIAPTEHPGHAESVIFTSKHKFNEETKRLGLIPAGGCDADSRPRTVNYEGKQGQLRECLEKTYYDLRDNRCPRPEPTRPEVVDAYRKAGGEIPWDR